VTLPPAYQAALDYIFNYVDYERRRSVPYTEAAWDLDRTRRVLAALGNPQAKLRYVHVAGSKGKGSTAANIESVLRASGLRVGFYTSPHLHTFRERIRVDGKLLQRDELLNLLHQCQPAIEAVPGITTFEIITAIALLHFAQQEVPWAVLEVGLGGRLDATNVITPAVSVITPISFEHTALLGDTLDQIAREKAGIVKPGVPVVSGLQEDEALAAIAEVCARQGSRLAVVGRDWHYRPAADSLAGQVFDVTCSGPGSATAPDAAASWPLNCNLAGLHTPLLGLHQLANATTAVAACWELAQTGVPIDEASLRLGLANVRWPARLEVLQQASAVGPTIVLDSAHNASSARLLVAALAGYFPERPVTLVFGASNDKDVDALLRELVPMASTVIISRSRHPRAADPADLARRAEDTGASPPVRVAGSVAQALAWALAAAPPSAVICITGSLFVAGEGREAWLALNPQGLAPDDPAYEAEPMDPAWQVAQTPSPSPSLAIAMAGNR
jgi:dihydrofolate synthase/folylpolyglutamate synthase